MVTKHNGPYRKCYCGHCHNCHAVNWYQRHKITVLAKLKQLKQQVKDAPKFKLSKRYEWDRT